MGPERLGAYVNFRGNGVSDFNHINTKTLAQYTHYRNKNTVDGRLFGGKRFSADLKI